MARTFAGFPPGAVKFLRQLKRNNNRAWFLAHKDVYEQRIKAPMFELVLALGTAMQSFAPELVTDPKRAIYRIYRDTRFSADKSPYKTQVAAVFAHRGMPKHRCASLYFHVAPEEVLVGGGVYMPEPRELFAIRRHIAGHWQELHEILNDRNFRRLFGGMEGEQLARVPKGFAPDHPALGLLRYKQFLATVTEPRELAESPALLPRLLTLFGAMMPFVRFLNAPLTGVTT